MTGQRIALKSGWQLLILAGAVQWAIGCGSSSTPKVDAGAGGSDGGSDAGSGGKLGGVGGRGVGGSGGTINPACVNPLFTANYAFGAIFDGWYVEGVSSAGVGPKMDGGVGTTAELDQTVGDPTVGSIKLNIPYTTTGQIMLFARQFTNGANITGATVSAKVKLDSGLISGPSDTAYAFIVFKSGAAYTYAEGVQMAIDPSLGWQTITASASAPNFSFPDYSPCEVREIDVAIRTGDTGTFQTAVVHIDTITISTPGADGGSDGTTDGTATETGGTTDSGDAPVSTPDTAPDTASTPDTAPDTASTPDASDASSAG